jgi:hypothetical protein
VGELIPVLPSIVHSFPLTSTHESASSSTSAEPSNVLWETVPPVVPSLISMLSAVVPKIALSRIVLRSLLSGSHEVMSHQLLSAVPT